MTDGIDLSKLVPREAIQGEDVEETCALHGMLDEALHYIQSHKWCPEVSEAYMGLGIDGVLAVFLVKFADPIDGQDECLWVIVGDLPPAYLVVDEAGDPVAALSVYCSLMDQWVEKVRKGEPPTDCFPVHVAPSGEYAEMLAKRIAFIREKIIPEYEG